MTSRIVSVELEGMEKRSTSFVDKPRVTLKLNFEGDFSRDITIPKAVGKRILKCKSDFICLEWHDAKELLTRIMDEGCWERLLKMLERRDYAQAEATQKLIREGYKASVKRTIDKACDLNLISDLRFADAFIHTKLACGWGRQRIARELKLRGVEVSTLEGWPERYVTEDAELERALASLSRRPIPRNNAYKNLVAFLVRRGYSLSLATKAVKLHLCDADNSEDNF